MSDITLKVNGSAHTLDIDPSTPLLYILRNDVGVQGPRFGYSKQSARPSLAMVAAPSRICEARRVTKPEGCEAERSLGSGRMAASRAA